VHEVDPCVVGEDVDPAEALHDLRDNTVDCLAVRDVQL